MRVATKARGEATPVVLYDGGVVMSLPVNSAVVYAARARAEALVVALAESGGAVTKAGGKISGVPDLSDPVERQGVWDAMFALSLAEMQIVDWQGIRDENGNALPFSAASIVHVMADAHAADLYIGQVMAPHRVRESEKNV